MTIKFPTKYLDQADAFFGSYDGERIIVCPETKMKDLKKPKKRTCRFCRRSYPTVKFKSVAHIIPELLGNKYLVSDFECDECNHKFGRYDDDLSKYIGISRTIDKTVGKNGIPEFKGADLTALRETIFEDKKAIKISAFNSDTSFRYDAENDQHLIEYKKQSYIPLNVYKALLKMFLCLIQEIDIPKYSLAFQFLQTPNRMITEAKGLMLFGYKLSSTYENPFAIIFKKRNAALNYTTHSFVLFYKSYMYQIFPPFHIEDKKYWDNLIHPKMPPWFDGSGDENLTHQYMIQIDLGDKDLKKDDVETIRFGIKREDHEKLVGFDPNTKKIVDAKYDPKNIVGVYLVDQDLNINLNDINKV